MSDDVEDGGAGVEAAEELGESEGGLGFGCIDGKLVAVGGRDALAAEVGGIGEGLRWREGRGLGERGRGEESGEQQG